MAINTPFLANNGNPNTVYNTTASPFAAPITLPDGSFPPITTPSWGGGPADPISYVGTMPAPTQTWGSLAPQRAPVPWAPPSPPVSTQTLPWQPVAALGGATLGDYWTHQQATGGVPASGYADPASQYWRNMTQMAPATFNLSNSGALWGQGGGEQPAPAPAPEPSPEPTGPWQTPDPTTPVLNGGGQQVSTGGTTGMPGGELGPMPTNPFSPPRHINAPSGSSGVGSGLDGLGNALSRGWDGLKEAVGVRDGELSAWQILDWFMPGNIYDERTGKFRWDEAAKAGLNMLFGGLGNLVEMALENGAAGEAVQQWLNQLDIDGYMADFNRDSAKASQELSNSLFNDTLGNWRSNTNINLNLRDIPFINPQVTVGSVRDIPGWDNMTPEEQIAALDARDAARANNTNTSNAATNNPFGGGTSAGSSTIAQGAAAQRWLEDQKLAALMGARPVAGQRVEDVFGMAER